MIYDLWPDTVYFAPLVIALLRIIAGITLVYVAYLLIEREHAFTHITFPFIGKPFIALVWVSGFVTAFVGASLIMGFYTQLMALVGMIIAAKHLYFARSHAYVFPLSVGSYALLFAIFFVIFICGTGSMGLI